MEGTAGLKLLELILLPGLVFAWGFWELYKLGKDKKEREAKKKARAQEGAQARPASDASERP